VEHLAEWLEQWGIWAIGVSLLLNVVISLLGVVPSVFLSAANAAAFGLVPGFFVSWSGELLGAAVSYFLYRRGFLSLRKGKNADWKWLGRINQLDRMRQFTAILLARLTPFVPSGIVTFVGAASSMRFADFILATLIGKAPSIALETLVGHDFIFLKQNTSRFIVTIVIIIAFALLFGTSKKKAG
jgi:uncharacterized membrane protein YdjX (TVP38/TMEM64 family)